jgi:hypothetical protein
LDHATASLAEDTIAPISATHPKIINIYFNVNKQKAYPREKKSSQQQPTATYSNLQQPTVNRIAYLYDLI